MNASPGPGTPAEPQRDPLAIRCAFDAWYFSMPDGWQDSYTKQGRLLVAFTHGWDERLAHDAQASVAAVPAREDPDA